MPRTRSLPIASIALALTALGALGPIASQAQGPGMAYFYDPRVELPWAELELSMGGGSRLRIPFLPVLATGTQAPMGTHGYRDDVALQVSAVLVGDGLVTRSWDAYRFTWSGNGEALDVEGKAVVLCHDCRLARANASAEEAALGRRLATAAERGAAAVILFSLERELPFLEVGALPLGEIPAITVSRSGALAMLEAAGAGGAEYLEELASAGADAGIDPPPSRELIFRTSLRIDGTFAAIASPHFVFRFRDEEIPREAVQRVASLHEASLESIREVLGPGDRPWPVSTITYFAGFDSKVFFTRHWGSGLADEHGVFLVWDGGELDSGLVAHEHAHTYTGLYWGGSSSFLNEGVARFVEAQVTLPAKDHDETLRNLQRDALPPLSAMLGIEVGSDELTPVAYPAAGSFVGYLAAEHGLDSVREVYRLEGRPTEEKAAADTWDAAFGKSIEDLDRGWREWLRSGGDRGSQDVPATATSRAARDPSHHG